MLILYAEILIWMQYQRQ